MGLRPVRGRLLGPTDDGPQAAGAAVLTHRFWTSALASDPDVLGKIIRLGDRSATIVGIVEPSVPYPAQTEIIANVVTGPPELSADGGGEWAAEAVPVRGSGRAPTSRRRAPSCVRRRRR
jgi:hypothetical protein